MDPFITRQQQMENWLESALLLGSMVAFTALLGWQLAGISGAIWTLLAALFLTLSASRLSGAALLRMQGAREIPRYRASGLHALVTELARRAHLRNVPRLFLMESPVPQAMAVGAGPHAALAVTRGLLQRLDPPELAGVLGHEISHIRHGDTRLMVLAQAFTHFSQTLSRLATLLFFGNLLLLLAGLPPVPLSFLLLLWLAPGINALLQLALSRSREFAADLGAAELTGDPRALARALWDIERAQQRRPWWSLFWGWTPRPQPQAPSALRSHPATEERIRRLLELSEGGRRAAGQPYRSGGGFASDRIW